METSNYYKTTIPKLIEKYKIVVEQCLDIMEQDIDPTLADDKLHSVLKAKRMASEDARFYAKEIDSLENELNEVPNKETKEKKLKGAERFARD